MASKVRPMGALKSMLVIQRLNFILREEIMILMDFGAETQLTRQQVLDAYVIFFVVVTAFMIVNFSVPLFST